MNLQGNGSSGHRPQFLKFIFYCFLLENALNIVKNENRKRVSCVTNVPFLFIVINLLRVLSL